MGIVYAMTSPRFVKEDGKEHIKIGKSKNLNQRMNVLKAGAPGLHWLWYIETSNNKEIEKELHDKFSESRIRHSKKRASEWFFINRQDVHKGFKRYAKIYKCNVVSGIRKENINLEAIGIGKKLTYIRDNSIKAVIIDKKYIEIVDGRNIGFEEEKTTLSGAANKLLSYEGITYPVNGALYWLCEGKILADW